MIAHLDELEVGFCYKNSGENEYMCLYTTPNFAVMLNYSHVHHNATLEFWNELELLKDYNYDLRVVPESDCPLTEFIITKLECIDNDCVRYNE